MNLQKTNSRGFNAIHPWWYPSGSGGRVVQLRIRWHQISLLDPTLSDKNIKCTTNRPQLGRSSSAYSNEYPSDSACAAENLAELASQLGSMAEYSSKVSTKNSLRVDVAPCNKRIKMDNTAWHDVGKSG